MNLDFELQCKINRLFRGFMKETSRDSFIDFLEHWELTLEDFEKIEEYFKEQGLSFP